MSNIVASESPISSKDGTLLHTYIPENHAIKMQQDTQKIMSPVNQPNKCVLS